MQTFVPYTDLESCVNCLDNKRLGKQRVEAMQIYNILTGKTSSNAWKNHPAVLMWKGYEGTLATYHNLAIDIWIYRGFKNTMKHIKHDIMRIPSWWGGKIHSTHRAALLAKNPEYYSQYNWKESPEINYYWPKKKR